MPNMAQRCMAAGADIVLGMLPMARELLRRGADVVLVANKLPAINVCRAPVAGRIQLEQFWPLKC